MKYVLGLLLIAAVAGADIMALGPPAPEYEITVYGYDTGGESGYYVHYDWVLYYPGGQGDFGYFDEDGEHGAVVYKAAIFCVHSLTEIKPTPAAMTAAGYEEVSRET